MSSLRISVLLLPLTLFACKDKGGEGTTGAQPPTGTQTPTGTETPTGTQPFARLGGAELGLGIDGTFWF